jgi:hypothetical protein
MKRIILLGLVLMLSGCIQTGTGTTTDTVHSIEYSGLICPTWKVWLANDHPFAGTETSGGSDAIYSIDPQYREQVLPIIQQAKADNKKITVNYRTELLTWGCGDELYSGYAIIETAKINQNGGN